MLRPFYILIFFLSFFVNRALAQGINNDRNAHNKEICIFGGISYYIGDLNQTGYFMYQDPAAGLGYRYNFNKRFALRANAWMGKLHATDANSGSAIDRQRNLSFHTLIEEANMQIEFNFLPLKGGTDDFFSPYIFAGIGIFHFNPQAEYNGQTYDLRNLSTEGQGTAANPGSKRYNLTQACIPFGMGFKWALGKYFGIALESGMRKTFTDYLDDVSTVYPDPAALNSPAAVALADPSLNKDPKISNVERQRGNSKSKDWYNFTGIVISITLPRKDLPCLGVQK